MLKIGLTGGIGSGKSTVAALFAARGVPIVDADAIAREIVQPGQPALEEIARTFGREILRPDGSLDRHALRTLVFADPNKRARLEALLHPRIRQRMRKQVANLSGAYCLLVIPLLLETGQTDLVDRVLVVDCPQALQIRRVTERDGLDRAEAERILAAQTSRPARLAAADDVIENDGNEAALERQVEALHRRYLALAKG